MLLRCSSKQEEHSCYLLGTAPNAFKKLFILPIHSTKKCPFYICRNANAEILSKFCTVTEPVIDGAVIHTQMYQTSKLTFSLLNHVVPMQNIHVSLLFI